MRELLRPLDQFPDRHIGPSDADIAEMLALLGLSSLDQLVDETVPASIREEPFLTIPSGRGESEVLAELRALANENTVLRSFLGMGYHGTLTPPVILRNILENPGWYTAYTPYQPEIAQGRLELLLAFQTMVADLTGMDISNASLLDEATACAEAMQLCDRLKPRKSQANAFFVDQRCHPQNIAVVQTRAKASGVDVIVGDHATFDFSTEIFGALVQYPATDGEIIDYAGFAAKVHDHKGLLVCSADLLSLCLLKEPGSWGADVVVGSSQRFGVPMGYGGPHAAFMATKDSYKRQVPGRIIGLSKDAHGDPALRMALQTREQHIRRHKATSNICTAQVLLAVIAAAYGVWHGPAGLRAIAQRVHDATRLLAMALHEAGHEVVNANGFDTLRVNPSGGDPVAAALAAGMNLRRYDDGSVGVSLDETVTFADLEAILSAFGGGSLDVELQDVIPPGLVRTSDFMTADVFHGVHCEHDMLRWLHQLENRDLALNTSMIPLGSCTMKLNATSQMIPITWPEIGGLHPFAPRDQAQGYTKIFDQLEGWLAEITGFDAVSLQPNAGSQGEYAGLLVIKAFHAANGEGHRDICLIPTSAHGTNPASAVMASMKVVAVKCDDQGNIDVDDLRAQAEKHSANLAALMVTYPSTHGVFETAIREICSVVHEHGGQVYLDGANMNAQVGIARPGIYGGDVCHLNLHKTFAIPHGGGGPGMGPIGVRSHLAPFLPSHPVVEMGGEQALGPISAAPWGSPSILPISWMYIACLGAEGLRRSTQIAILNANYVAKRLEGHYPVLYTGENGRVAHGCIIDTRPLKKVGVEVDDLAKRLMDYGFHAPTMSFPVAGTLMIEPTESESRAELDRFCDALIGIRNEVRMVESGELDATDNPLKNSPHTLAQVTGDVWDHPYSREQAAFPAPWLRDHKFWPAVGRIDNAWGDRNLYCTCPSVEDMEHFGE
ncbi:MAG: aminomethyl-transferring glycine dehydrogenase [Proteobacteria bacterium]|nr:aminomethyl-transferring glycine dehydrogenase [Pseudomonadota bacterium]